MDRLANTYEQSKDHTQRAARVAKRSSAQRLGNTRIAKTASIKRESGRAQRWRLRKFANEYSSLSRLRKCGKVPFGAAVSLRGSKGENCGYGGLTTCGSVWSCPVCSAKIAAERAGEIQSVIDWATSENLSVSMLTLTQRHNRSQQLGELWDALSYAWNAVSSDRRYLLMAETLGLRAFIRATEVTHSKKHGWHVHTHILMLSEKRPSITPVIYQRKQGRRKQPYPVEILLPKDIIANAWKRALGRRNIDFIADKGGLDWSEAAAGAKDAERLAHYVAKLGGSTDKLALEATLGQFKKAKLGNRTPFQILDEFSRTGDMSDLDLWHVWEKNSRGRRALVWSQGLRKMADLGDERTDEEIAADELGDEVALILELETWRAVYKLGALELVEALERGGKDAAIRWLEARSLAWIDPPQRE